MNQSEESSIQVDFARLQHQIAELTQKLEAAEAQCVAQLHCGHPIQCSVDGACVVCSMLIVQQQMSDAYQAQIATLAQKLEAAEATAIKREDRIHELKLEMDAERQRAEAAEQDTARLEWYNENALSVTWATGYLGSKSGWSYMAGNGYKQDAQSLREAIDLARKDGA